MSEQNYQIEIEICSEAIFSSGEKERNLVQSRALTDSNGFVYFHAKTLKGQLKRQAFWLLRQYIAIDKQEKTRLAEPFYNSIVILFGINEEEKKANNIPENFIDYCDIHNVSGLLKLSNLELDKELKDYFIALQKEDENNGYFRISPHDLVEAQTNIRTGIQLENGIVKNKMFNSFHTVKEGLTFYSTVSIEDTSTDNTSLINDLTRIVYSLRRIGAGIHRGRGEIKARLLVDGEEILYAQSKKKEGEKSV